MASVTATITLANIRAQEEWIINFLRRPPNEPPFTDIEEEQYFLIKSNNNIEFLRAVAELLDNKTQNSFLRGLTQQPIQPTKAEKDRLKKIISFSEIEKNIALLTSLKETDSFYSTLNKSALTNLLNRAKETIHVMKWVDKVVAYENPIEEKPSIDDIIKVLFTPRGQCLPLTALEIPRVVEAVMDSTKSRNEKKDFPNYIKKLSEKYNIPALWKVTHNLGEQLSAFAKEPILDADEIFEKYTPQAIYLGLNLIIKDEALRFLVVLPEVRFSELRAISGDDINNSNSLLIKAYAIRQQKQKGIDELIAADDKEKTQETPTPTNSTNLVMSCAKNVINFCLGLFLRNNQNS